MIGSPSSNELNGVIIGAGHFADIQLEAWREVNGAKVSAVVSHSRSKAEALAEKYDLRVFDDWNSMMAESKPDFIDICTPPDSHLDYTKLCVDARIPLLCQKPLAPTWEECVELVQYAEERKVPMMVNENWRWQAWYREIKAIIESGRLGKVYHVYFAMRPGDGWGEQPYPVQPYFKDMGKFLLFETGIHFVDTYRYLFGEIESVFCQTRRINPAIAGEDFAVVLFQFADGSTGIYDANRTTYMEAVRCPTYGWMTVEGTEGKLRLDMEGRIFLTLRGATETEHPYHIPSNGWKGGCTIATQQHFIDGLLQGTPFETNGPDYLKSVKAMFACYESMKTNRVVQLGMS
jgi:predicted dehydrogenase